jgi:hypothetical protein
LHLINGKAIAECYWLNQNKWYTEIEAFAIGVFIALVILPEYTIWLLAFIFIKSIKKLIEKIDFIIISDYSFA